MIIKLLNILYNLITVTFIIIILHLTMDPLESVTLFYYVKSFNIIYINFNLKSYSDLKFSSSLKDSPSIILTTYSTCIDTQLTSMVSMLVP
jgi:hypothetical protein